MSALPKKLKFLASLRLAVFIILAIAVISAVGTITESRYDAEVAQKLVYQSIYMYLVMVLLCVNLIAVMLDRWPWKQHHAGFVLAHVGIITLLFGSWLTQKYGIDGTMAFGIGESRNMIVVHDRDLKVYSSLDGQSFTNIFESEVDFLKRPPSKEKPFKIQLGNDQLEIFQYEHFAFREAEFQVSDKDRDGPAIRFELVNPNVNMTEWLRKESRREKEEIDLGPAKVVLANGLMAPSGRNEVLLISRPNSDVLDYIIYNKDNSIRAAGKVKQGETIETGWMGMKFRLLRYMRNSKEIITYTPSVSASPIAVSAFKLRFQGEEYWVGLNTVLRLYASDRMYVISYGYRQLELAFPLKLEHFNVGKYEGTERAASYESLVDVPGRGQVLISMNEPLKLQGFTFYQSSFEKNQKGEPIASILSVNFDPGRWFKYLGSLLMVGGSVVLFYFKRVKWIKSQKIDKKESV